MHNLAPYLGIDIKRAGTGRSRVVLRSAVHVAERKGNKEMVRIDCDLCGDRSDYANRIRTSSSATFQSSISLPASITALSYVEAILPFPMGRLAMLKSVSRDGYGASVGC